MKNLPGVFKAQKKNGDVYYRSSITFRSKHISLGSFDNEEDANAAYNDATAIIQSENTYFPDDFSKTICQKLDFKKWVSLINFKYISKHRYICVINFSTTTFQKMMCLLLM